MPDSTFVGMGHNPDGPELPTGLGMLLAEDPQAMTAFGRMTSPQKRSPSGYVQGCPTGEEAQGPMADVPHPLYGGKDGVLRKPG